MPALPSQAYCSRAAAVTVLMLTLTALQVEVDYQGGGTYKRKYRVREVIAKGPMDLFFTNTQV